jgi:hypothetical protein
LHLVEKAELAGMYGDVVVEAERQQHCLLEPLMGDPRSVQFLRDAPAPGVQVGNRLVHGLADRRGGGGSRRQAGALFPGVVDRLFE